MQMKNERKWLHFLPNCEHLDALVVDVASATERKTFVAPIFPEPIFLTSLLIKIFVNNKPNGTEPLK